MQDLGLHCPVCGYNLTGIVEYRCPECGFGYTHAALESLAHSEGASVLWTARRVLTCALISAPGAVGAWLVDSGDLLLDAVCIVVVLAATWWSARYFSTALPAAWLSRQIRSLVLGLVLFGFCLPLFAIAPITRVWWGVAWVALGWIFILGHPVGLPQSILSLPDEPRQYVLDHLRAARLGLLAATGVVAIVCARWF